MTSKVYGNPTRKPVLNSKRSVKRRKKKFHAGGTVQSSPQPKASPLSGFQVEATKDMPTPVGTMLAPDQVAKMSETMGMSTPVGVAPEQVAKMPDIGVAPAVEAVGAISEPVATPTLPKQMQQQQQMQQQMQQQLATQNQQQMQQVMAQAQQQPQQQPSVFDEDDIPF